MLTFHRTSSLSGDQASNSMHVQVALDTVQVEMLLDIGASISLIICLTYQILQQYQKIVPLCHSYVQLQTYTGQPIYALGLLPV